ncbi:MAG: glutamate ABC transporter substrate-binding protein [Gaiellales bacterium]
MRRRGLVLAAMLSVLMVAAACAREEPTEPKAGGTKPAKSFAPDSYMAQLQTNGKIRIGVKYDIPRFGFLNPATSKVEGFDVDLGNLVAKRLGVPAEFSEAISANRIPFLNEDKVDLIISTMTINDERKQQIDFSVVYYLARQRLLVKNDSPITDVKTLDSRKGKVCSASGSTSEKNIRAAAPSAEVVLQKTYSECYQLLRNAQVDAVTTDDVILTSLLSNDPANYKLTGSAFSQEPYGMGIKKGRVGFVDFVNDVIKDAKKDGTWVKLYDKWVAPLTKEKGTPPPDEVSAAGPTPASPAATTSPTASPTGTTPSPTST